jgi:hypothetical protein
MDYIFNEICTKIPMAVAQWLMTVIPATQEGEIGRIVVRGQPEQKVSKTPSQQTIQT